jgi:PTH1 family peptidyl-tRNA hydrolase
MRAIVGLGNPEKKYKGTPHNFGFDIIDLLASRHGARLRKSKEIPANITRVEIGGQEVTLLKPLTYMNLSGDAVRLLVRSGSFTEDELLIICDDVNLPVGRLRLRGGGTAGGHNGLTSIIHSLGTTHFPRLRIGIGMVDEEIEDLVEYVLSPVMKEYRPIVGEILEYAADAVECVVSEGLEQAMARFNGINLIEPGE